MNFTSMCIFTQHIYRIFHEHPYNHIRTCTFYIAQLQQAHRKSEKNNDTSNTHRKKERQNSHTMLATSNVTVSIPFIHIHLHRGIAQLCTHLNGTPTTNSIELMRR